MRGDGYGATHGRTSSPKAEIQQWRQRGCTWADVHRVLAPGVLITCAVLVLHALYSGAFLWAVGLCVAGSPFIVMWVLYWAMATAPLFGGAGERVRLEESGRI